ncbi:hypothetical protein Enr13x_21260 [Stieleria neptunia]|uniref:Dockerin domain-containing protein n=2 Tax=Stieleria neptunia TaxID=2527979 RepID=A0A518HN44_9BACT|nr:hypothetical protein Enr13x_21260 [Stieleria neptunia]
MLVFGYDPARHDRFQNDSLFLGSEFNWSGVGRGNRWAVLVSDSYVLGAAHSAPSIGSTIEFYPTNDPSDGVVLRTVIGAQQIGQSDLWLGQLDRPVGGLGQDDSMLSGGDSGGPTFTIVNGKPVLVGIHWFTYDDGNGGIGSADSIVADVSQIAALNAAMNGESLSLVNLTVLAGDMNADGVVDNLDVGPFAIALLDRMTFAQAYPEVDPDVTGDFNGDGVLTNSDIDGFSRVVAVD